MASSQDYYQTQICGGGWWNPGRSLFPPCPASMSDFMWLDSSLNDMDDQVDQMKQGVSYSRSDDSSDDHHYSSSADGQHLSVISSDYAQTFQHVQKPRVADFNISNWSAHNLAHDSPNMSRLRPVVNDQKSYTCNNSNSNIHDYYIQEQFNSTAEESQTGLENITSSFAYPAIIQSLDGPDAIDMSYAFGNSFAPNWPKMPRSPSPKEQLNTSTKNTNANKSMPFWDCWMGIDELDTHKSHQLHAPVMIEDQKPCNYENPTSTIGTVPSPKIGNKDTITQKLASGSALLGTKRKNKNTTRDELYKRPRFEAPSSLPTFKVRKEKLGDRITALQQLVSPFGKTDTASVLHEAIEYIKFLHDQVSVLRTPYMQTGTLTSQGEWKNAGSESPKQDLKSRGLCLVPISSTFPVANETTADFWTPTFGGKMTFR